MTEPTFLIVDLFCGAGGTTTGFAMAELEGYKIAKVIACINHDHKAIVSHWKNHPEVKHFEEDIRTLDLTELVEVVRFQRSLYPNAKLILWASLECTNFSKAKGGQPRDADSRTLAETLYMHYDAKKKKYHVGDSYIQLLNPDYLQIENVVEFMSWGPLDEKGKPVSRKNGSDWMRWRKEICAMGYRDEWKELNSANYGAYTSRNRLFGCFVKQDNVLCWPQPTHAKKPSTDSMHGDLKKWMPVKHVLDFKDEGESIFTRKKPLSDKTLERIYAGLIKFIAKGDTSFISKYYSGKPANKNISVEGPAGTIKTVDGQALVNAEFITQYNGGAKGSFNESRNTSVDDPLRTVTTENRFALVQPVCLLKYDSTDKTGKHYPPSLESPCPVVIAQGRLGLIQGEFLMQSSGGIPSAKVYSVNDPSRVITTSPNQALVQPDFIASYYGNGDNISSVENPAPTIPTKDRCALVQPEFLINYNHSSKVNDVNETAPTLLTMDKIGLVQPEYFIDKHYSKSQNQSIEQPAGAILPTDKHRLVKCDPFIMPTNFDNHPKGIEEPSPTLTASRKHHYLVNPSHGGHTTSIDAPCPVIIARQDKAPLYFVQVEKGNIAIAVFDNDSEICIRIKQFMSVYGLVDIKMRMLRVLELLKIQGFPEDYKLEGNQSDQKKFIGNSVHPLVPKYWAEALAAKIILTNAKKKVA